MIEERFDPDRTVLTLPFMKKATKKKTRAICENPFIYAIKCMV